VSFDRTIATRARGCASTTALTVAIGPASGGVSFGVGDEQQRRQGLGGDPEPFGELGPVQTLGLEIERQLVRGSEVAATTLRTHASTVQRATGNVSRSDYAFFLTRPFWDD
jgi:hypothetical protein